MKSWCDRLPCVYSYSYDGEEYEIQHDEKLDLYAVFEKQGFYSYERCSEWYNTPQEAFQADMDDVKKWCIPDVKAGDVEP